MPCPTSKKTSTAKNEIKIENFVFFLDNRLKILYYVKAVKISLCIADMAQSVERILGKDEVTGSNPVISSKNTRIYLRVFFLFSIAHLRALLVFAHTSASSYSMLICRVSTSTRLNNVLSQILC